MVWIELLSDSADKETAHPGMFTESSAGKDCWQVSVVEGLLVVGG